MTYLVSVVTPIVQVPPIILVIPFIPAMRSIKYWLELWCTTCCRSTSWYIVELTPPVQLVGIPFQPLYLLLYLSIRCALPVYIIIIGVKLGLKVKELYLQCDMTAAPMVLNFFLWEFFSPVHTATSSYIISQH